MSTYTGFFVCVIIIPCIRFRAAIYCAFPSTACMICIFAGLPFSPSPPPPPLPRVGLPIDVGNRHVKSLLNVINIISVIVCFRCLAGGFVICMLRCSCFRVSLNLVGFSWFFFFSWNSNKEAPSWSGATGTPWCKYNRIFHSIMLYQWQTGEHVVVFCLHNKQHSVLHP